MSMSDFLAEAARK